MEMKRKTLSNRTKIILTMIALLVSIVGTTYAWWTASFGVKQEIKLGNLQVVAEFNEFDDSVFYEPGTTAEINGEIKNTGSVPVMMKVVNSSGHSAVGVTMEPASGSYEENGPAFVGWFKNSAGQRFVLLDPGASIAVKVLATLDDSLNNSIQNDVIEVGIDAKATQVIEGALAKELGIDLSDLQSIEDGQTRTIGRSMAYLQQLLAR